MPAADPSGGGKREPLLRPPRPATAPPFGGGAAERASDATTTRTTVSSREDTYWSTYAHRSKLSTSAIARRWGPLLLGAGGVDLLLAVLTVVGIYRGDVQGFWTRAVDGYGYHASVADAVGLALGRGLLTALVGAAILCLHHSARGGEGAGRGAKAAAWLAVLVNVGTVAFLVAKAITLDWQAMDATDPSDSPAANAAVLALLLAAGSLGLPALGGYLRAVRAMEREFASLAAAGYSKLPNERWVDVEEGKKKEEEGATGGPQQQGNGGGGSDMDKPPPLSLGQLLKILKPYFWPSRRLPSWRMNRIRCLSTWVFVTGSKVSSVFAPLFLSYATTALTGPEGSTAGGNAQQAAMYAGIYCLLVFGSRALKELQGLVYLDVKKVAYAEICSQTFEHLLGLSLHWHLKKKIGVVIRAMDRGTDAADTVVTYLFLYLLPAIGECVAVCVVFLLHFGQWDLALLLFSSLLLYGFVTIRITLWRRKFREMSNKKDNEIHERATDTLVNFETVKAFTNEKYEKQRFQDAVRAYQGYSITTQASLSLLNGIQQLIVQGCTVGALILTARRVANGSMSVGDFVAVNAYTAQAFQPLNFLGSVYTAVIKALVDMQNLNQLLLEAPDVVDAPNAQPLPPAVSSAHAKGLAVRFDGVSFHYPEQNPLSGLKQVDFEIRPGTTTALVGSTGSGKSTCARLLFRFYDPISGRVLVNGRDVRTLTQASVRALIGVVPQDTCLFNDTLLHNIKYGRLDATMAEVEAAVEAAQLKAFIDSLPQKYETVVGERGLKLSGGEKQRVAIARCLLKDPPMVLLDEATSALDSHTEAGIQEALLRLRKNRTTLVIAHRLSTIKHADQILVLDKGSVVERGTHEALLAKPTGAYAKMWALQLRGNRRGDGGWEEGEEEGVDDEDEEKLAVGVSSGNGDAITAGGSSPRKRKAAAGGTKGGENGTTDHNASSYFSSLGGL